MHAHTHTRTHIRTHTHTYTHTHTTHSFSLHRCAEFSPDRVRLRVREDDLPEDETRESKVPFESKERECVCVCVRACEYVTLSCTHTHSYTHGGGVICAFVFGWLAILTPLLFPSPLTLIPIASDIPVLATRGWRQQRRVCSHVHRCAVVCVCACVRVCVCVCMRAC